MERYLVFHNTLSHISHFFISHLAFFYLASRIFLSRISHFYLASHISHLAFFISHFAFFISHLAFLSRISHFFISHLAFFYLASRIFISHLAFLCRISLQNFFLVLLSRIWSVPFRLPYLSFARSWISKLLSCGSLCSFVECFSITKSRTETVRLTGTPGKY